MPRSSSGHGLTTAAPAPSPKSTHVLRSVQSVILDSVSEAIERDAKGRRDQVARATNQAKLGTLTDRERQVLDLVVAGRSSKEIAHELGLSGKTVEVHRSKILAKMQASNAAD